MTGIRAIETRYKGYRFRSRLEARWAVFFDALGLSWEYEPEGYVLADNQHYLPDFRIKDCGMFVEVKGERPDDTEVRRCAMLADQTGKATLLVHGLPGENPADLFCWDLTDSSGGSFQDRVTFIWPASCEAEVFTHSDTRVDRDRDLFLGGNFDNPVNARHSPFSALNHPQMFAVNAARSARFEHGESGGAK